MTRSRFLAHAIALGSLLLIAATARAGDGCEPEPITPDTPTGVRGCEVYGEGTASMWGGPGVARNDCVWPWVGCQTIAIQSLETGITIIVVPRMFGDLYTGTPNERIVDLDPAAVAALGLDASRGLWPVKVTPVRGQPPLVLPDTAYNDGRVELSGISTSRAESHRLSEPRSDLLIPGLAGVSSFEESGE